MVATDVPPTLMGDYHIPSSSPANDALNSAANVGTVAAPAVDIDGGARPTGARFDLGADELPGTAVVAFPRTGFLDQFGRANGAFGSNWDGDTSQSTYRIASNQVQVRGSGTVWWSAGQQFGANQEAYLRFTKLGAAATQQGLLLKAKSPGQNKSSYVKVVYVGGGQVQVWTKTANNAPVLRATFAAPLVVNDSLGARAESDGTVTVYRNGVAVGTTNVTSGANPWPTALAGAGGRVGVTFTGTTSVNDATFDDFGGGTRP